MNCPVCKGTENHGIGLQTEGFQEDIIVCEFCGSSWSINHGKAEMIRDTQEMSFLEGVTERVEGDDYCWAA